MPFNDSINKYEQDPDANEHFYQNQTHSVHVKIKQKHKQKVKATNQGGGGGKVLAFLGSILRLSNVSSTAGSPTSNGFIHTTHNPGNCK